MSDAGEFFRPFGHGKKNTVPRGRSPLRDHRPHHPGPAAVPAEPGAHEIVLGVFGRAQRLYEVSLCSFVAVSSHYHMLVWVKDARQLAEFMQYFNGNLAKEVARRTDWKDKIFARRYQAIQIPHPGPLPEGEGEKPCRSLRSSA